MGPQFKFILCFIFILCIYGCVSNTLHKKFEYKYSFKPPYLAQKDGSVPFWEYGGNAIASSENVRVAPSLRSQKGAIWTKQKTNFEFWEVDILFRITGRGRVGADGLAFWFTENKGAYDGPVFGSSDKWRGIGVFFDSFDNDNKHNNPYIMAVYNDGTMEFDHQNDGSAQMLAGCLRDFRNKPFPTRAKIEYYMGTLTVLFHNGMTNNDQDFEHCLRVDNIQLPKSGHFGISAATGGLADDHDVQHFLTFSLYPPGQIPASGAGQPRVSPEEETKLTQEYAEYQRKLEHTKEEYRKEHPGVTKDETEFDEWFESDSQRELRQIFSGQKEIFDQVKHMSNKLDEVIGRQERALSMISSIQHGSGVVQQVPQPQGGHAPPPPQMMGDSIRRHEVDNMISNQNTLIAAVRELKNFMIEVHQKAESILSYQARGGGGGAQGSGTAQVQALGYDTMSLVQEVRESLNHIKRDTETVAARIVTQPPCATSCLSVTSLLVAVTVQLVIMLGYSMYRDSKKQQSKKFY